MEEEEQNKSGSDDERNRSFEAVHSDDLENEMNYSDEEIQKKEGGESKQKKQRKKKAAARIFKQEVDTNVQKISLATLKSAAELATGDPVFCKTCSAVFN